MWPKGRPASVPQSVPHSVHTQRTLHQRGLHLCHRARQRFLPRKRNQPPTAALTFGFHMKDHTMTLRSKTLLAKPLILLPLLALLGTAGCETFKGAGRDISGAGQTVTSGAIEVQNDL
jgi:predicted small secreted protein